MKQRFYIKLALVIIWMIVIFSFSAQDAKKSLNTSNQFIIKTAETIKREELTSKEKDILINKYIVLVRKSAHFFLYFVLGILMFLTIKEKCELSPSLFIYVLLFCFIYACSDELHQVFTNGRAARLFDVFIDSCGALLSTTVLFMVHKLLKKRIKTSE